MAKENRIFNRLHLRLGEVFRRLLEQCWPELCVQEIKLRQYRHQNRKLRAVLETQQDNSRSLTSALYFLQERLRQAENAYAGHIEKLQEAHRKNLEALHEELGRDELTGLLNRNTLKRAFHRHAHEVGRMVVRIREQTKNQKVTVPETSVLFIDVDRFKLVNDLHGHTEGDRVLIAIARVIMQTVREDDIPARYGGDEFVVILGNASTEEATHTAQRIREAVEKLRFGIADLAVTVSIGVARIHLDRYADDPNQAIDEARTRSDMAMYEAKHAGRNQVAVAQDSVSFQ